MAVYIPDALKTIQVAFYPPIIFSGTVMIQNDVRLHNFPKTIHVKLLWLSYVDDLKSRRFFCCSVNMMHACSKGAHISSFSVSQQNAHWIFKDLDL